MKIYFAIQRYFVWSNPGLGDSIKIIGVVIAPDPDTALALIPPDALLPEGWNAYDPEVKEIGEYSHPGKAEFVGTHW